MEERRIGEEQYWLEGGVFVEWKEGERKRGREVLAKERSFEEGKRDNGIGVAGSGGRKRNK